MEEEEGRLLWSRVLRGLALLVLLIFVLPFPLVYLGWFVVSREDLGLGWHSLLGPLGFALMFWLASRLLEPRT